MAYNFILVPSSISIQAALCRFDTAFVMFSRSWIVSFCLPVLTTGLAIPRDTSDLSTVEWRTNIAAVDSLIEQLTGAEKVSLVTGGVNAGAQNPAGYITSVPRLGIPATQWADGEAHEYQVDELNSGINSVANATAIPNQINVAATWSKDMAYKAGHITGLEARLLNMSIALAPRVNLLRDPVDGSFWQGYSEDPFLNAQLGIEGVNGIQDQGTMANVKQIGPSSTGASMGDTNSVVDLQVLHEVYWSPYGALIEAGGATLMCSYAQVNGVPACQYEELFNTVRNEFNFTGITVSDWGATHSTANSIMAGLDLEMPGGDYYGDLLYDQIYVTKNLSETYLNRAVGHILQTFEKFGLLNGSFSTDPVLETTELSNEVILSSAEDAYEIAVKSGVLLKNTDGALPLSSNASIGVFGPNGLQFSHGTGFAERAWGFASRLIAPFEALQNRTGNSNIPSAVGIDLEGTVIPASALSTVDGTQGLTRNDSDSEYTIDSTVDFSGDTILPANKSYTWKGYLHANTSGIYHLSFSRQIFGPGGGANNSDYNSVWYVGSVSVNGSQVAQGYRLYLDGGLRAWSTSITTRDGWDNIGASVYLEAGSHEFSATIQGALNQPVAVRLSWVTPEQREKDIQAAVALAKTVTTPIVFAYAESSAQVALTLDNSQDELVTRIAAANPNTIVVLNNAEPVLMPWLDSVSAVLAMGFPGQEGGWATADLLLGNRNPQGRLPVTYPTSLNSTVTRNPAYPERIDTESGNATFSEGLNISHRWYYYTNTSVLFPFGYGLTYTSFSYSGLEVTAAENDDAAFTVSFNITNTGTVAGVAVPQVYVSAPSDAASTYPGVQFAAIMLVGFANEELAAGETMVVDITVQKQQLKYWDVDGWKFVLAEGKRTVWVGQSIGELVLEGSYEL
ncbi:MAG: hypothetical protein M1834_004394 [Cirrosporium novae-zelandiae]|nr:MAG: hypothetical protein M1834_004394 [Cirrosporium novae-zelandiae]